MILNLKLKHFSISSMQNKYINAWLRTRLRNDCIIFYYTHTKLTLIRLFPIWLPLLGTAPTHKLKKRTFDNSKLNLREDAFQSIALCLAATFPYIMAFARKWISPVYLWRRCGTGDKSFVDHPALEPSTYIFRDDKRPTVVTGPSYYNGHVKSGTANN